MQTAVKIALIVCSAVYRLSNFNSVVMDIKKEILNRQGELRYVYEAAQARMKFHPEVAEKFKRIIKEYPYYKTLEEAVLTANKTDKDIWAKIRKNKEFYDIQDYFIVSNDNRVLQAAEYIGMFQLLWLLK